MEAMASSTTRTGWQKIARRIRVPLGFLTAAVFLVFASPSPRSLLGSLLLVGPGLWLRGYAAGFVRKNAELTRTGPYAFVRNPLYLGSIVIAFGFTVAAGRWPLGVLLVALFLLIYVPTIKSEEAYLRSVFPAFDAYADRVPRLLPRLTPARFPGEDAGAGSFGFGQYRHHREYNALIGALAIYAALALRLLFWHRGAS